MTPRSPPRSFTRSSSSTVEATFLSGKYYKGAKGFAAWREEMGGPLRRAPLPAGGRPQRRLRPLGRPRAGCTSTKPNERRRAGPAARPRAGATRSQGRPHRGLLRGLDGPRVGRHLLLGLDQRRALLQLLDVALGGLDAFERGLASSTLGAAGAGWACGPDRLRGVCPARAALAASGVVGRDQLRPVGSRSVGEGLAGAAGGGDRPAGICLARPGSSAMPTISSPVAPLACGDPRDHRVHGPGVDLGEREPAGASGRAADDGDLELGRAARSV